MHVSRVFLLAIASLLLSACGESTQSVTSVANKPIQDSSTSNQVARIKVALIMKTLTNPFFVEMEKGARKAQQETGIDLQVMTASQETSIEQQIQLVENQIAAKVDAIVIAPGDSQRLVPVLKKAQDAGITIVNIDNRLLPEAVEASQMKPVPFISVNNERAAYQSAKYLVDTVYQPTEAVIIEGIRSADNANKRLHGAEKAFKENSKIKLVAKETANWKIDEAYAVAQHLFGEHPKIKLVFCANDMMAIGVIKYLQDEHRQDVLVAGFDALEEAKNAIYQGKMLVTIDQQAAQQGYQGVMAALKLLRKETVPLEIEIEAKAITAKDLK
ncbi:MAG: sugar ABC transporter substrate-binding protein [Sideroxydans sp.]|nr:sugar ABC transporter substrate-binding protein [Sideroxydans sp.]